MLDNRHDYLTLEDGAVLSFPYDWKQTFAHPFDMGKASNEAQIVKNYVAEDKDRVIGLEILKLLLDYTFATRKQLERLLTIKGISEIDRLDGLLQRYLDRRIINAFTLGRFPMDKIPDDAFVMYCLDHSSRHILSHFYRDDVGVTWKSTNALRSAEIISKYLVTNEFYLSLMDVKQDDLAYFEPAVDFLIVPKGSEKRSRNFRMSAAFCLMKGATKVEFVLEVVRSNDLPIYWRKKSTEQLAAFIQDNFWQRYYRVMPPTFLFLAENLEQGEELSEIFTLGTGSDKFRVTTDKDLVGGIDKAVFYKFNPNAPDGQKMVPVKAGLFQRT